MKRYQHQHRDDDEDRDRVLKDGERLRVPMPMMDAMDPVQKAIARASVRVVG